MSIMMFLIVILILIVLIGVLNERVFRLQSDIALVLFSTIISLLMVIVGCIPGLEGFKELIQRVGDFGFETYLLDFVLCFMLFAGASKVNMGKFRENIKAISLLALLTTVISSALYGLIFWSVANLFKIEMDIWICILLGCIVSPTDPIAATGILNKLGLSKNVTSVIESESLFNDGTGVALFVFVKSIVTRSGDSNFFVVMIKEVAGAFAVAFLVSFVLFRILKLTKDPVKQLVISLLDVSLSYLICEHFGFSGVIASVVCGMYFAYKMGEIKRQRVVTDPHNLYVDFWEVMDTILNAILFVMIGVSILDIEISKMIGIVIPLSIVAVIVSRFLGVALSGLMIGKKKIPSSYSFMEFVVLMTWSALKGGLSLALAMSTKEFLSPDIYLIVLNTTYITIFFTVIGQGLSVTKGYRMVEKHKANRIRRQSEARR